MHKTLGARLSWQLNFVYWHLLCVVTQHQTCFISPCGPIILKWSLDFWNICVPLLYSSTNSKTWHKMEVSGQLYTLTVLSWGKEIPLPTG